MTTAQARRIVRRHYQINRAVTVEELELELRDLVRRRRAYLLDDRQEALWAALNLIDAEACALADRCVEELMAQTFAAACRESGL